jgi:hypothetical protein
VTVGDGDADGSRWDGEDFGDGVADGVALGAGDEHEVEIDEGGGGGAVADDEDGEPEIGLDTVGENVGLGAPTGVGHRHRRGDRRPADAGVVTRGTRVGDAAHAWTMPFL